METASFVLFAGLDWGTASHQICVVDAGGEQVAEFTFAHDAAGVREMCRRLEELAAAKGALALAIESPSSPATEPLLEAGLAVFSLNPKQLDRFRDRHFPAGAKDDRRDAFVLATSLRTDRACFRRLRAEDPRWLEMRDLSRLDRSLRKDRLMYCNRLRDILLACFPDLLALSPAADEAWLWHLLALAPSAPLAARLARARLRSLLRKHRIRRFGEEELMAVLRRPPLPLPAASFARFARQIQALLPVLDALDAQQRELRRQVEQSVAELAASEPDPDPDPTQHRDVTILLSLPGVGMAVAAAMLSEAHEALASRDYHALRAYAGVAPVTRQSGKSCAATMRRSCNPSLRHAVYHWSRVSAMHDPRSKAHYARLRQSGKSHGRALRGVADRLLKVLCSMLRAQTTFDPQRYLPSAQPATGVAA